MDASVWAASAGGWTGAASRSWTSFDISCCAGYWWWTLSAFQCLKKIFILASFLKDTFNGYKIPSWQYFFSFAIFKMFFQSLLAYIISDQKKKKNLSSFSHSAFKIFFVTHLSSLITVLVFLMILGLRFIELLQSMNLYIFHKLEKALVFISSNTLSILFPLQGIQSYIWEGTWSCLMYHWYSVHF